MPAKATAGSGGLQVLLHSNHMKSAGLAAWQADLVSDEALFGAFTRHGLDYKGATISGFSQSGLATTVSAELDFGKMYGPCTTLTVKPKIRVEKSSYVLLLLTRFPSALGEMSVSRPVSLAAMTGWCGALAVSLGVEGGFKVGIDGIESDKVDERGSDNLNTKAGEAINPLEVLCAKVEAKIVVEAGLSYEGTRMVLRDTAPSFYGHLSDPRLVGDFTTMLGPGNKADVKARALAVFDDPGLSAQQKALKPERSFWKAVRGHNVELSVIKASLDKLAEDVDTNSPRPLGTREQALLDRIEHHRQRISYYVGVDENEAEALRERELQARQDLAEGGPHSGGLTFDRGMHDVASVIPFVHGRLTFLDLWGHRPEANAAATATFTAQLGGQGAELGGVAEGSVSHKWTLYRYQTHVRDPLRYVVGPGRTTDAMGKTLRTLVMTQDTKIGYFLAKGGAGLSGEARVGHKSASVHDAAKRLHLKPGWEGEYRRLTYRSAVVYWLLENRCIFPRGIREIDAQPGSGYSYGASFPIAKLHDAAVAAAAGDAKGETYLASVGKDLHVSVSDLLAFFGGALPALRALKEADELLDEEARIGAVLLESSFRCDSTTGFACPVEVVTETGPGGRPVSWCVPKSGIRGDFRGAMEASVRGAGYAHLQAIRLRVRQADTRDASRTKFKLGLRTPVRVVELGFELESVDKAGHEAVVDLHCHWFGSNNPFVHQQLGVMKGLAKGSADRKLAAKQAFRAAGLAAASAGRAAGEGATPAAIDKMLSYDGAVPPVALLHQ